MVQFTSSALLSSEILRVTLSSNRYREVGGRELKLEISPREDNVQNNVAVKMKFDQRFNVPLVEDRTMEHKGSRGASCQEARP